MARVLAAFANDTLDDAGRELILALGGAHLALTRADEGTNPPARTVMDIGFRESSLLLDPGTARAALREAARRG